MKLFIRNDDVAFDTDIKQFTAFLEVVDKYNVQVMQCLTPLGAVQKIEAGMSNSKIVAVSGNNILADNIPLVSLLKERGDVLALHGLWHTHKPRDTEIYSGYQLLKGWGLKPTCYVPPFNEWDYTRKTVGGMRVYGRECDNIEMILYGGRPKTDIVYLHSWRFNESYHTLKSLDQCLQRLLS